MAKFVTVGIEAKNRTAATRSRGYAARAPFRHAITNLTADQQIEIVPDEGETLRGIMLSLARAAKEVNRRVTYGPTEEGTLIVWLTEKSGMTRTTKRRKTMPR